MKKWGSTDPTKSAAPVPLLPSGPGGVRGERLVGVKPQESYNLKHLDFQKDPLRDKSDPVQHSIPTEGWQSG